MAGKNELPTPPSARMVDGGVEYAIFRYRFLFANGDILDVETTWDDSSLRSALLAERRRPNDRIIGSSDPVFVGWMRIEPKVDGTGDPG